VSRCWWCGGEQEFVDAGDERAAGLMIAKIAVPQPAAGLRPGAPEVFGLRRRELPHGHLGHGPADGVIPLADELRDLGVEPRCGTPRACPPYLAATAPFNGG